MRGGQTFAPSEVAFEQIVVTHIRHRRHSNLRISGPFASQPGATFAPHFHGPRAARKIRCADKPLCVSALRRILSCQQPFVFFCAIPPASAFTVDGTATRARNAPFQHVRSAIDILEQIASELLSRGPDGQSD
jgi:hypothetical protein